MAQWDKKYEAYLKKEEAASGKEIADQMSTDAAVRRDRLNNTLRHTLSVDDTVDWNVLKDSSKFEREEYPRQLKEERVTLTAPPPLKVGFFQILFWQRGKLQAQYDAQVANYTREVERVKAANEKAHAEWVAARDQWNTDQDEKARIFVEARDAENGKVDTLKSAW